MRRSRGSPVCATTAPQTLRARASAAGGTAWYEARLAQVELLAEDGRASQACELLRGARGRATTPGGDELEARLREMEPKLCR